MIHLRSSTWLAAVAALAALALSACAPTAARSTLPAPQTFQNPIVVDTATPEATATSLPTASATESSGASLSSVTFDPAQLKASLDTWAPAAIASSGGSACSIAAVYDDAAGQTQTTYYNYGTLSRGAAAQVDESTEYEIGSVTKLFTADILAQEVVDGKVSLDDPIKGYLPAGTWTPSFNSISISVGQLATHSSGLPQASLGAAGPTNINGVPSLGYATDGEVLHWLSTYQLLRGPGQQWEYTDGGYAVLGLIVERINNTPFEKLVQSVVAGPLGLTDTRVTLTQDEQRRLAQGYTAAGQNAVQFASSGALLASAGLRSTAKDMAAYLAANLEPGASQMEAALKLTLQAQGVGPDATSAMGLGWQINGAGTDGAVYSKFGATDGYSAFVAMWPARNLGFVALCNGQAAKELAPKISAALGGSTTEVDTNP